MLSFRLFLGCVFVFLADFSVQVCGSALPNVVLSFDNHRVFGASSSDAQSVHAFFGFEPKGASKSFFPVFYPSDPSLATGCGQSENDTSIQFLTPSAVLPGDKFAILFDRGDCSFHEKVLTAQALGAVAVLIANQESSIVNETSGILFDACTVNCETAHADTLEGCESKSKCSSHYCVSAFLSEDFDDPSFCCVVDTLLDINLAGSTSQNSTVQSDFTNISAIFVSIPNAEILTQYLISENSLADSTYLTGSIAIYERKKFKVDPSVALLLTIGVFSVAYASFRGARSDRLEVAFIWGSKKHRIDFTKFMEYITEVDNIIQKEAKKSDKKIIVPQPKYFKKEDETEDSETTPSKFISTESEQQNGKVVEEASHEKGVKKDTLESTNEEVIIKPGNSDKFKQTLALQTFESENAVEQSILSSPKMIKTSAGGTAEEVIGDDYLDQVELSNTTAISMLVFACFGLIGLFFLVKYYSRQVVITIIIFFGIGSMYATSYFVIRPVLRYFLPRKISNFKLVIPDKLIWLFDTYYTFESILGISIAISLLAIWLTYRHEYDEYVWIIQNLFSFSMACIFLTTIKINRFQTAFWLLIAFCIYDIFMVFITPFFGGGQSVMLEVATAGQGTESTPSSTSLYCSRSPSEQMPMLFLAPRFDYRGGFGLLGLGDILLPGLLLTYLIRVDYLKARLNIIKRFLFALDQKRSDTVSKYFVQEYSWKMFRRFHFYWLSGVLAYGCGLVITFVANLQGWTINGVKGQPALLYLVPFTLGTFTAQIWYRGEFDLLWTTSLADLTEAKLILMVRQQQEHQKQLKPEQV